jgi:hypothetical protein
MADFNTYNVPPNFSLPVAPNQLKQPDMVDAIELLETLRRLREVMKLLPSLPEQDQIRVTQTIARAVFLDLFQLIQGGKQAAAAKLLDTTDIKEHSFYRFNVDDLETIIELNISLAKHAIDANMPNPLLKLAQDGHLFYFSCMSKGIIKAVSDLVPMLVVDPTLDLSNLLGIASAEEKGGKFDATISMDLINEIRGRYFRQEADLTMVIVADETIVGQKTIRSVIRRMYTEFIKPNPNQPIGEQDLRQQAHDLISKVTIHAGMSLYKFKPDPQGSSSGIIKWDDLSLYSPLEQIIVDIRDLQ